MSDPIDMMWTLLRRIFICGLIGLCAAVWIAVPIVGEDRFQARLNQRKICQEHGVLGQDVIVYNGKCWELIK